MKLVILFILLTFQSFLTDNYHTNAQTILKPEWVKKEVGSVNNHAEAWGVDVDGLGNVYWAVNANNLNQGLDITCYKFNSIGSALWSKPFFYGGAGAQQSYILNASDTALYIGGRKCPFLLNTCDMLLLKVDKDKGTLIWDRTKNFSGNGYDELDGLELKEDGIYCGGWAHELEAGIFKADLGLWKLDYSGNTEWTNYFGKTGSGEHQDGHFVVDDNYIYAAGLWDGGSNFNVYNGNALLGKFDKKDGKFVDSTLFGTQSNNYLDAENALGMTNSGEYLYITGYTTPKTSNDWQIFVAKYDKNLNQIWYTDWGGSSTESARAITVVSDKVYVGGLSSSITIMSGGVRDAVLLILDTSGNVLSYQTWGDTLKNGFLDIYADSNCIYLTGTTEIDSMKNEKTAFLLKVASGTIDIEDDIRNNDFTFNVSPNPSHGKLEILWNNKINQSGTLTVTDIQGKLISKKRVTAMDNSFTLVLDKPGVFFISLDNGKYRITKKVMNY